MGIKSAHRFSFAFRYLILLYFILLLVFIGINSQSVIEEGREKLEANEVYEPNWKKFYVEKGRDISVDISIDTGNLSIIIQLRSIDGIDKKENIIVNTTTQSSFYHVFSNLEAGELSIKLKSIKSIEVFFIIKVQGITQGSVIPAIIGIAITSITITFIELINHKKKKKKVICKVVKFVKGNYEREISIKSLMKYQFLKYDFTFGLLSVIYILYFYFPSGVFIDNPTFDENILKQTWLFNILLSKILFSYVAINQPGLTYNDFMNENSQIHEKSYSINPLNAEFSKFLALLISLATIPLLNYFIIVISKFYNMQEIEITSLISAILPIIFAFLLLSVWLLFYLVIIKVIPIKIIQIGLPLILFSIQDDQNNLFKEIPILSEMQIFFYFPNTDFVINDITIPLIKIFTIFILLTTINFLLISLDRVYPFSLIFKQIKFSYLRPITNFNKRGKIND